MRYRTLGRTGLNVSLLSFGSGGPSKLGQNTGLSSNEQNDLIRQVLDLGINFIDSSEGYGDSEEILGRGLEGIARDSYFIATKGMCRDRHGKLRDPKKFSAAIDKSLKRLGTDYIDVMQFHLLNMDDYDGVVDTLYPVMEKAREEGKIRFIGFSEQYKIEPDHRTVTHALRTHPHLWDTVMLKYGILNQYAAKEALPLAQENNVGIINMAVIREKLPKPKLLGDQIKAWKREGLISHDALDDSNPLGWLIKGEVRSVVDAGYIFASEHPGVSTVLTGTSSISHLQNNVRALQLPNLPESDTHALKRLFGDIAVYI